MATIVYRGPFQQRFKKQLEYWLNSDDTDDTDDANDIVSPQPSQLNSTTTPTINKQDMLSRRTRTIEKSYEAIKSRGSAEQRRFVFENLSILQQDIQSNCSNLKRDFDSQTSTSLASEITDENLSPRKRNSLNRKLFDDKSVTSKYKSRPPLLPIDMNSRTCSASSHTKGKECATIGSIRRKKQERMKEKKAERKK